MEMKIDITELNKGMLKNILKEQIERDEIICALHKDVVDHKLVSEEDLPYYQANVDRFNRRAAFFLYLIDLLPDNLNSIDLTDEERLEDIQVLIKDQIYVSEARVKDFQPSGCMYNRIANTDKERDIIIQYDRDCIDLCEELKNLTPECDGEDKE